MSKLRSNPKKKICQNWLGVDKNKNDSGLCGELAVIRCNACKQYYCEECWIDHLESTIVVREEASHPCGKTAGCPKPNVMKIFRV
jgi:hypothetical protein